MQTVSSHGRAIAYSVFDKHADGDPILFVHGSGGSQSVWSAQRRLADRYPVITMDLSGHGESEDVDADPGYTALSAYADDVMAVAEETDVSYFVGSSLGGAVIVHLLLDRGISPDGVALSGTIARMGVLDDLLEWIRDDLDSAIAFLHRPDRFFHDPSDDLIAASEARMRECDRSVIERDFRTCDTFDVRGDLDRIDTPTLAISGEFDRLTPPREHESLAKGVRDGTYLEIDNAAHLSMIERPESFNTAVGVFFDSVGS